MITSTRHGRRIGCGITGLAATVAIVTGAAPTASAAVTWVKFETPAQTYYVGTDYRITAGSDPESMMAFYDNGQCIGKSAAHFNSILGETFAAVVEWVPATAGHHVITVDDGKSTKTLAVDVEAALPGSTPDTPVAQGGCSLSSPFPTGSS
ncbi:hypothetical protein ACFRAQ_20220 [Nocardia sp. NPDC056611]|uniref:hypothetical protein n=1 Tax=Nocardia sp. NPDC056611 TaxID=3345877 RepID=UPI00366CD689